MNELLLVIFRVMIFLSVALFVIGIFKPEWLRFRQKQLGRTTIIAAAIGILIIGFTGAGAIQYAGKNNVEAINPSKLLGEAVYAVDDNTRRCDPGTKPGTTGASNDEKTSAGIRYMVKTPVNYNANIAHPLLMVYAPGGKNRYESENYMYLTQEANGGRFYCGVCRSPQNDY
jgi:polyhydroxybutyrate depolymerase